MDDRHELGRVRARRGVAEIDTQLHGSILRRYRRIAVSHPELTEEQAYVDHAYACLDTMRSTIERAADATDNEVRGRGHGGMGTAAHPDVSRTPSRGLCFGRLTLDAGLRPLYVGRRWVHDDRHDMLVVNWQAPASRPFYTAHAGRSAWGHAAAPLPHRGPPYHRHLGRGARRQRGSRARRSPDFLLEELERRREGRMRDIVATIQSDQYRLITAEPSGALVVQGGPGTGKTAVGLHRASWLLYTHREQLRRVLVVGPESDVHGLRLARAACARRGRGRAARRVRAAGPHRGEPRRSKGRRAPQGRPAARGGRAAGDRAVGSAGAGGARALRGPPLRVGAGARGRRAARRGNRARRGAHARARPLPDGGCCAASTSGTASCSVPRHSAASTKWSATSGRTAS